MTKHKRRWDGADWLALAGWLFVAVMIALMIVLSAGCDNATEDSVRQPPTLPQAARPIQVLLMGDSITRHAARELDDPRYNFHLASQRWGSSRQVLTELPGINTHYDIIYIRIGLHDILPYKNIPIEEFTRNMRAICWGLKRNKARIILGTLTIMPSQQDKVDRYNERIITLAQELGIELHDCRGMFGPDDLSDFVHLNQAASKHLADAMIRQLERNE